MTEHLWGFTRAKQRTENGTDPQRPTAEGQEQLIAKLHEIAACSDDSAGRDGVRLICRSAAYHLSDLREQRADLLAALTVLFDAADVYAADQRGSDYGYGLVQPVTAEEANALNAALAQARAAIARASHASRDNEGRRRSMLKPWFMRHHVTLTLTQRLRILFGSPLVVSFISPDGNCHAACRFETHIGPKDW